MVRTNGNGRYTPSKSTVDRLSNGVPVLGAQKTGISTKQARMDTCALFIGKQMELATGDRALIAQTMEILFQDPERLGSVCLTLLNYCAQFATASGNRPTGIQELIDHMLIEIGKL